MSSSHIRGILVAVLTAAVIAALLILFLPVHTGETEDVPGDTATDGPEDTATDGPEEDTDDPGASADAALSLRYDDRYSFAGFSGGSCMIREIQTEEVTSYRIGDGSVTGEKDAEVLTQVSDTDVVASGTGTAVVTLDVRNGSTVSVAVTVEPAPLSLLFLTGQSNMEGVSPEYDYGAAVLCEEGQIYSTYAPSNDIADSIANTFFPYTADAENAGDFVAESLTSDTSRSGTELAYQLNSLSASGQGKTGPDSGLAYEWNRLTGDKVWVVNTAWTSTSITAWVPGGECYDRTAAVSQQALLTYEAEVDAGHYLESSILMFWLQGEDDYVLSREEYESCFFEMYDGFREGCGLDAFGIISVRTSDLLESAPAELAMTSPRIVQYAAGSSGEYPDLFMVSNANEQWETDWGTAAYFQAAYPNGFTYPTRSGDEPALPASAEDVHREAHYMQPGHNENGISAADGMYTALTSGRTAAGVTWRDADGNAVTGLSVFSGGKTVTLVPVADPVCLAKTVTYTVNGGTAAYDVLTAAASYITTGVSTLTAVCDDTEIGSLQITSAIERYGDFTCIGNIWYYDGEATEYPLVQDESGRVYDTGEAAWWYVRDGVIDITYTGPAENEYGTWFVEHGMVGFSYSGFAEYQDGWLYVEDGRVLYREFPDPVTGTLTRVDEVVEEEEPAEEEEEDAPEDVEPEEEPAGAAGDEE